MSVAKIIPQLAQYFNRNGYVRRQKLQRLRRDGYRHYKKGDEVRLVAGSLQELATIRSLLQSAGFRPGRPFAKARQYCQPVYGREAVRRFLDLVSVQKKAEPSAGGNAAPPRASA
jgi:hypothetical protein